MTWGGRFQRGVDDVNTMASYWSFYHQGLDVNWTSFGTSAWRQSDDVVSTSISDVKPTSMSDVNKRPISDVNTHIWVFSGPHGMTYTTFGTHLESHAGIFRCVSHCNADGFRIFVTDMAVAPIHKFLGEQNFLWRRKFFFCAVMPKTLYHHPLYWSQFMC